VVTISGREDGIVATGGISSAYAEHMLDLRNLFTVTRISIAQIIDNTTAVGAIPSQQLSPTIA
jgi:hypothetical protein